jgi:hypothetical protein
MALQLCRLIWVRERGGVIADGAKIVTVFIGPNHVYNMSEWRATGLERHPSAHD